MFIIETNSKPLRNWSKLMFVLFLVTHVGLFGGLLTMHVYVKPRQTKPGLEQASKHNIGDQVESGARDGTGMARTIAIWIFGLLASAIIGAFAGILAGHFSDMSPYASTELWGALAGMFTFACIRLWLAAPSKNSK
jgi:hypothetical protein